jgi:hypothetical protein
VTEEEPDLCFISAGLAVCQEARLHKRGGRNCQGSLLKLLVYVNFLHAFLLCLLSQHELPYAVRNSKLVNTLPEFRFRHMEFML